MVLRKGLKNISVNETIEFELSFYNVNKFKKLQFSGFLNENPDEFWYLPTHQELVDELKKLPRGSLVRATRLTQGGPKESCRYEVEVLREGPKASPQKTLDSL